MGATGADPAGQPRCRLLAILLAYVGYTSCPDVCPTTLSDARPVTDRLGGRGDRIDLAMVTTDPEVDTAGS